MTLARLFGYRTLTLCAVVAMRSGARRVENLRRMTGELSRDPGGWGHTVPPADPSVEAESQSHLAYLGAKYRETGLCVP